MFLPAYIANMMPVFFATWRWLPKLDYPIDCGKKIGDQEIFGKHKTYRGFVAGILGGLGTSLLQFFLYYFFSQTRSLFLFPFSFDLVFTLEWGILLGFGALAGDALKSFFKRRLRIPSGAPFFLFDQLDFVIGGLLAGSFIFVPSISHILILLFITPLLHFFANIIGYKFGWKKVWW